MDAVFTRCTGLDMHQKTDTACRVTPDPSGQQADESVEVKEFGALARDLLALPDWLAAAGITAVATGKYGRGLAPRIQPFGT